MGKLPLIILAAGKGTRLYPLSETTPKPLMRIFGKSIIEHIIDSCHDELTEVIIIAGHQIERIKEHIGDSYRGLPVHIIEQTEQRGTGDGLARAREVIADQSFYACYGDAIYQPSMFSQLRNYPAGMLVKQMNDWSSYGVVVTKDDGTLQHIVEKPTEYVSNLVNLGVFKFPPHFLDTFDQIEPSSRGEYELTDMIAAISSTMPFTVCQTDEDWLHVTYPWDLLTAAEHMANKLSPLQHGRIEENVHINGTVVLGADSVIKSGTVIDGICYIGKSCSVGPNSIIRGIVSVGDNTQINGHSEIKNSLIGDDTKIHSAYIGDSIIGNKVNIAYGTVTANKKHDNSSVRVLVKGELLDTHRNKLGAIIGDGVRTGINTSIYPGRTIGSYATTLPGTVITDNIFETDVSDTASHE
ncbi:MAG: bifunctional sugar-1-phosphate nucleotidylyltransferase/acetyltransferase [Patescibacteria group bacterium]